MAVYKTTNYVAAFLATIGWMLIVINQQSLSSQEKSLKAQSKAAIEQQTAQLYKPVGGYDAPGGYGEDND